MLPYMLWAALGIAPGSPTLPDATPIRLRLERALTLNNYQSGDPVDFTVAEELRIDGYLVIARGTRVTGIITAAEPQARVRKIWKLGVSVISVPLLDGGHAAVRAAKERAAEPGALIDTGSVARPGRLPVLFTFGKAEILPEGTLIAAYVDGDVKLDPTKFLFDVSFTSNPPGALVTMYGSALGTTPFHARLAPGAYKAVFSVDGFYDLTETVNVGAGFTNAAHAAFVAQ